MSLKCLAPVCFLILTLVGYGAANRPPRIRCPTIPTAYYADKGRTSTKVTWAPPRATDPDGGYVAIRLRSATNPGSMFTRGTHTVIYEAKDKGGLKDFCSFSFTVIVIQCNALSRLNYGTTKCDGRNYGHRCTFSCDPDYRLVGASNTECQRDRTWTHPSPSCVAKECPVLPLPPNSKAIHCTDGWKVGSVCWLICDETRGYAAVRGQYRECSPGQTWTNMKMECVDIEKPQFQNCPTQTLVKSKDPRSALTSVTWDKPIRVKDNSGEQIDVKSLSGFFTTTGGMVPVGTTKVQLTAQDSSGNAAPMCSFHVRIESFECEAPAFDDEYLSAPDCDDVSEGMRCHLRCKRGLQKGPRIIECKKNASTSKGFWSYGQDDSRSAEKPYCEVRNCTSLRAPNFGAMTCSELDNKPMCMLSCRDGYDIPRSEAFTPYLYVCGADNSWSSNHVPDCTWRAYGEKVRMNWYNYFTSSCSSAMAEIKAKFIAAASDHTACPSETCSAEHVQVQCGDEPEDEWWKKKRSSTIN